MPKQWKSVSERASSGSNLNSYKAVADAKSSEDKRSQESRRSALVLVLRFLADFGYMSARDMLEQESGVSLSKCDVADNIDLMVVLQEYETYFEDKYAKKPKFYRKAMPEETIEAPRPVAGDGKSTKPPVPASGSVSDRSEKKRSASRNAGAGVPPKPAPPKLGPSARKKEPSKPAAPKLGPAARGAAPKLCLGGAGLGATPLQVKAGNGRTHAVPANCKLDVGKPVEPPNSSRAEKKGNNKLGDNGDEDEDSASLTALIYHDMLSDCPGVMFSDIVGLEGTKRVLREAVVIPTLFPQLFTGLLSPWRGVLLYGPPGTGKTMLAKAVATECHTAFFNVSSATMVSKYRGDSEKLVRTLFEVARHKSPSVIFMDELDSIMTSRDGGGEHEASRRMKTELMVQMDGLTSKHSNTNVFVLAASNLPWDLDHAVLRRFEKRILVPLPSTEARFSMFQKLLGDRLGEPHLLRVLAERTDGYSGADAANVAKEAAMRPLRRMMSELQIDNPNAKVPKMDPVNEEDLSAALSCTKPSNTASSVKYTQWAAEFGAESSIE